ncbi:immunity 53 family protein [Streptomyces sp. MAR4 CNY-716]
MRRTDGEELLRRLDGWYAAQCDGDWEHGYGVRIETLDNPGWLVRVDLVGTDREGATLAGEPAREDDDAWLHRSADGQVLRVACGPGQLARALRATVEFLGA